MTVSVTTAAGTVKPRLLDLFCCQGGAAMGYHRAGFEVTGVDISPQPRYPFQFHQADALAFVKEHGHEFDAIHASPPCHDHTALKSRAGLDGTAHLLPDTREALQALGKPYVIENVPGAPIRKDLVLCGEQFGLRTVRHRWFEFSDGLLILGMPHIPHSAKTSTKKRKTCWDAGMHISVTGDIGVTIGSQVMKIDWMTRDGLSQAIPPDYTEYIGRQLISLL